MITKASEPCSRYFGKICSGFGAPLTCLICGWDLFEHPEPEPEAAPVPHPAATDVGEGGGERG